ncbi:MAG: DUF624 domain-containing protein [Oscillospiraceae bacterium]|nr:DUF624 domain-containing protein [Oscillospiraceae bacterium]
MNGLFNYDSPIPQLIMRVADVIILNLMYLLFCIPIFTIGAAQAGLYTAAKVMMDKEDDTSLTAAFFRGFKAGFGTITLSWGLVSLVVLIAIYVGVMAIILGASKWLVLPSIAVAAVYQCLLPIFHSRFGCTFRQIFKNCVYLLLYYPLHSIAVGALIWLPVILFAVLDLYVFMALTPAWLLFYYSSAHLFAHGIMKKPFQILIDHFEETH